jgi:hypothetical protein
MFARIRMMRALHRHRPKAAPAPRRKRAKASFDLHSPTASNCVLICIAEGGKIAQSKRNHFNNYGGHS